MFQFLSVAVTAKLFCNNSDAMRNMYCRIQFVAEQFVIFYQLHFYWTDIERFFGLFMRFYGCD